MRVRTIQPIDAHLLETAVLAIILNPDSGLEVEPLGQAVGIGGFKGFGVNHVDQGRGCTSLGFVAVGRNHHSVERNHIFFQLKVDFKRFSSLERYGLTGSLVTYGMCLGHPIAFGQVFQVIMSGGVSQSSQSGTFNGDADIGQMVATLLVGDVSHDVGIRFVFLGVVTQCR